MQIQFLKMQALGNDFVVLDAIRQSVRLTNHHFKRMCDRHFGIGADQVIVVTPPRSLSAQFAYRVFNANGQAVEQCLNGAKCAARFVWDTLVPDEPILIADSPAGPVQFQKPHTGENGEGIRCSLLYLPPSVEIHPLELQWRDDVIELQRVDVGNPHAIWYQAGSQREEASKSKKSDPLQTHTLLKKLGHFLNQKHPSFPAGVNLHLVRPATSGHLNTHTYERGVGLTLACGSGALAVGIHAATRKPASEVGHSALIRYPHGVLEVGFDERAKHWYQIGPARSVFSGTLRI